MGVGAMVETQSRRRGPRRIPSAGLLALVQGSAFFGLAMAGLALLVVLVLVPALAVLGVVAMVGLPTAMASCLLWCCGPAPSWWCVTASSVALLGTRRLAKLTRRLSDEWLGLPILESYLPAPDHEVERLSVGRLRWMMSDPATWRDLFWMVTNASCGWILAMVPVTLASVGLIGCIGYGIVGFPGISPLSRSSRCWAQP